MINSRQELAFFLAADKFALGRKGRPRWLRDEVWKFQIALRQAEYWRNHGGLGGLYYQIWRLKKRSLGLKLGFDIPEGVFDAGLRINHFGSIIVNSHGHIGRWCDIHQGVVIGASNSAVDDQSARESAPHLGDNVWIGPSAKIFGGVSIGPRVQIGANSVVGRSFDGDVTIAGVPAMVVAQRGTSSVNVSANPRRTSEFFATHPEFAMFDASSQEREHPARSGTPAGRKRSRTTQ